MRLMKAFPLNVLSVLAGALLCSAALPAQNSSIAPRITTDVNELSLATLKGNLPRLARAEFDQGEAAPSTPLTHMRLVLSRSAEQQAALDSYLAQLQSKSSPNYHKWLTPEQFGQIYGPADSDIAALVAWLESHGLQVETVSKGRTNIAFNGTVSQVEEAFHTSIHNFQAGDRQFFSNTADPQIPAALAAVVKGVAHLNTIRPRPHFQHGSAGQFNPQTRRLEPVNTLSANGVSPELTETGPDFLYLVPGDAATIYDTPNSFNANFTSGTSYTGAGVNIGLGGDATISASIVGAYRSTFLGSATSVNLNYCTTSASCSTTPGSGYIADDADEAYIDTELSGGMAPGATIYYYASPDLYTGIEAAIDANVVSVFSLSFGDCESDMGGSGFGTNEWFNSLWSQAAMEGIAVNVSAGDSGSAGCDYPSTNSGKNVPDATGGLAVSGFASTPYNIAVGGTDLYGLGTSFTTYASTSQGSSSTFYRTALKYIPESTWNDSTTSNALISANVPSTSTSNCAGGANIVAGSGGASVVYPKPSWQTGAGVPSDNARDLPDVAFMSGNGCEPATWLVCTADRNGKYTSDCETQSNGYFYFDGYGGTSTASPVFAGILALVQQKTGSRLGMPATVLYGLYNGANSNSIFHDQNKLGNNSVPCIEGSTASCQKNAAGYYFESGYNTNTGYDLATGMGSVDVTQLMNYWGASSGSAAATISFLSVSPNPVTTAQNLTVTISVSGASGTPTGTITLTGGSYNSSQTIGSGACTASGCAFTVTAGNLPIGTDTLTVTYGGNTTYAVATNSTTVTVNGLTASVTANPSATSINSNQQMTVTGTVACTGTCTGSTTPTGTVTLTGGGYTSAATALSGTGTYSITILSNSLSAGTDTLTVTYNGSSIYSAGAYNTTSVTVTYVAVSTPTVTVAPASGSIDSSQTYSVTVTVSGSSTQESSPTGTVTLSSGSYTSAAVTLGTAGCTAGSSCVTIIIPANGLGNGADTLTANYSGDADYSSGTPGTATVTVTKSAFALQATNIASLAPGATTGNTSTITVSSSTFYSGTITLTCALTNSPSGAAYLPSCSNGSNTLTLSSGVVTGTASATVTVYTTAATSELNYPKLPGKGSGWAGAGGGTVLAFLVFLGIPSRRRSWRAMLGILILMTALGSLAACGGGGTSSGPTGTPGTTAGAYTFTVTGTGNDANKTTETKTFTVTVS